MMYAKQRSTYYVQLEDDVLTKKNFVKTMKDAAMEWSAQVSRTLINLLVHRKATTTMINLFSPFSIEKTLVRDRFLSAGLHRQTFPQF